MAELVGQIASVLAWYPTTLIRCQCREGSLSIVIVTGLGIPSLCGSCGRTYIAQGLSPDGKTMLIGTAPPPSRVGAQ